MAILEINKERGYMIVDNFEECIICKKNTNRIDFCYECRLCGEECEMEFIEHIK